ncbi:hypothetical protein GCM10009617_25140 [Leifsonia poae]
MFSEVMLGWRRFGREDVGFAQCLLSPRVQRVKLRGTTRSIQHERERVEMSSIVCACANVDPPA